MPPASDSRDFTGRIVAGTAIVLGLLILLVFLWHAVYVLLLLFGGVLLAVFLRTVGDLVARVTGLSRGWSLAVGIVLLLGILGGLAFWIAPQIGSQVSQLADELPNSLQELQGRVKQYRIGEWLLEDGPTAEAIVPDSPEVVRRATGVVSSVVGALFSFVVVLIVGIYLAADPTLYTTGLLRLVPPNHRQRAAEVLGAVGYTLRWWLIGQLAAMTAVGVMTALGLWALGVPLALTFGLLAFLLDFVPNFGPFVAAAPAVLITVVQDPNKAIYVALLYVVVQQIEGLLITPLIQQRAVQLPPVLTIVSQVLLGALAGPLGLLLATPLTAATLVLVKMLYVQDTLGDHVSTPDDELGPEDNPPVPKPEP